MKMIILVLISYNIAFTQILEIHKNESQMDDFNFLNGKNWKVTNSLLKERLAGNKERESFEARLFNFQLILGGLGNIDQFSGARNGISFEASSLRIYNEQEKKWSIYWIDNISQELVPQVVGSFKDGIGEFFGSEKYKEKEVKLRFLWSDISENHARWEQAYFDEQNRIWETNWVMEFIAEI